MGNFPEELQNYLQHRQHAIFENLLTNNEFFLHTEHTESNKDDHKPSNKIWYKGPFCKRPNKRSYSRNLRSYELSISFYRSSLALSIILIRNNKNYVAAEGKELLNWKKVNNRTIFHYHKYI